MKKFSLLVHLGQITVPENHVVVSSFAGGNFSSPSYVPHLGEKFRVCVYQQVVEKTTGEERLEFLDRLGSKHLGAQGARLAHYHLFRRFPGGFWFSSLDEPGRLWIDERGYVRVPEVPSNLNQDFRLGLFNGPWRIHHAFFSFT